MDSRLTILRGESDQRLLAGNDLQSAPVVRHMNLRFLHKIVQREHASRGWRECSRDLRIAGVGPVLLSSHQVLMNWGMKRLLHLAGGAGELDQGTSFGRANLKAVRLKPHR